MNVPELLAHPWAMEPAAYNLLVDLARAGKDMIDAKAAGMGTTPEALRLLIGQNPQDEGLDVRSGVAVIPVRGHLTRRPYWRGDKAAYEWIGARFAEAIDRSDVRRIVLEVDSGGGQVNGVDELVEEIFKARGTKPITSYVLGQASSAAYWIASAADRIVSGRQSMLGSIGVVWTFIDWSKYDEQLGIREVDIVSSQSPNKRPDVTSAEGRGVVQKTVDDLAAIFIADVARNRGVSEETVVADFGEGWVLVGEQAVAAGLADAVGRFSDAITESDSEDTPDPTPAGTGTEGIMSNVRIEDITAGWIRDHRPNVVAQLTEGMSPNSELEAARKETGEAKAAAETARAEGAKSERERIVGILGLSGKKIEGLTHSVDGVFDDQIAKWVADPNMTLEAATSQYETLAKGYDAAKKKAGLGALRDDEAGLDVPSPGGTDEASEFAANVKSIGDYVARTGALIARR